MLYQTSCEEHKYLAGLRKEKDAFEKLIKERGVSFFFLHICDTRLTHDDAVHVAPYLRRTAGRDRRRRSHDQDNFFSYSRRQKRGVD